MIQFLADLLPIYNTQQQNVEYNICDKTNKQKTNKNILTALKNGSHSFYIVTIKRKRDNSTMLLATDRRFITVPRD